MESFPGVLQFIGQESTGSIFISMEKIVLIIMAAVSSYKHINGLNIYFLCGINFKPIDVDFKLTQEKLQKSLKNSTSISETDGNFYVFFSQQIYNLKFQFFNLSNLMIMSSNLNFYISIFEAVPQCVQFFNANFIFIVFQKLLWICSFIYFIL